MARLLVGAVCCLLLLQLAAWCCCCAAQVDTAACTPSVLPVGCCKSAVAAVSVYSSNMRKQYGAIFRLRLCA